MFFLKKTKPAKGDNVVLAEFKRLWNEELLKTVDSRNFSKAYNYALRKYSIRDMCMKTYFDFESEDSLRFREACNAFDEGDIFWTYMIIRQFASVPGYSSKLKNLTNKRRTFLSEKRKETVITRNSARMFLHNLMQTSAKQGEEFIKNALADLELYEKYCSKSQYKSAYKIIALTDKPGDYASNIKKYLYYAAKRERTDENEEQTLKYFEYAGKYYNFKRKLKDGSPIFIHDIDIVMAMLIFMRNGGAVSREELKRKMHRTVKVYCVESCFAPVCVLADYLYQIGETEFEQMVLKLLVHYGEAINDKYRKRYTCLELMSKNSEKFIFRHKPHTPLECVLYDNKTSSFEECLTECLKQKEKNQWCIAIKHTVKTYEFSYKYFYDDKLLSTLETVLDNEFGDFVLEYSMRTYFNGDDSSNAKHSMIIITSGKNQYSDFPKIGIMIKIEPITKKFVNVHYCVLYLPEEEYTEEMIEADSRYVETILGNESDSRFETFSMVIENLTWNTVNDMLSK